MERYGEFMALHVGTMTEWGKGGGGGRQEATSQITFYAFELYPVNRGEPMKRFKQRSPRIIPETCG